MQAAPAHTDWAAAEGGPRLSGPRQVLGAVLAPWHCLGWPGLALGPCVPPTDCARGDGATFWPLGFINL